MLYQVNANNNLEYSILSYYQYYFDITKKEPYLMCRLRILTVNKNY